ncbi:lantibiotic dehydratase [Nocardia takedensis]
MKRWYEPLEFAVVRAPLLPTDTVDALADSDIADVLSSEVRTALTVASLTFSDALTNYGNGGLPADVIPALRRYMIRMSTRATPLGLFAGVGLARWGRHTDIELGACRRPRRTRPDSSWLMTIIDRAERNPEIRRQLRVVKNHMALARGGRFVLTERPVADDGTTPPISVSVRATEVVRQALALARTPIRYSDLAARLLAVTPCATETQVETLLDQLCEQSLLLTELRPPLTVASPARHLLEQLRPIAAAAEEHRMLVEVVEAAASWDAESSSGEAGYRRLVAVAREVAPVEGCPLQVDSGLALTSDTLSDAVAQEAARAAELLIRTSPISSGQAQLDAYRRAFERRYGAHREVPIVELVDPHVGLGGLPAAAPVNRRRSEERNALLVDLAVKAVHDQARCVVLDEATLMRLHVGNLSQANAPLSLDLTVLVSAGSREAIDAGDFELAIGPSIGSMAAGRMLGRFADFVPNAREALSSIAAAEAARTPGRITAELTYAPRLRRLANVAIRPNVRLYEIAVGGNSGADEEHTIPLDELVVGVRGGRFYLRWTRTGEHVVVTAGHMLTPTRAPMVCRLLSALGRDGERPLAGFSWGTAGLLPYLPRLRHGRVVLALAQWRLRADMFGEKLSEPALFRNELEAWRARWNAPAELVIARGDHRLPLDLTRPAEADELRRTLRQSESVVLTEAFPARNDVWLTDSAGRCFAAELVVPLVRSQSSPPPPVSLRPAYPQVDLRPPGSEWLFVKLYAGRDMEDDILAGPIRELVEEAATDGFSDWFFVRYTDTESHIRLRFRGDAAALMSRLLPRVSEWATSLMESGVCQRFSFDTYEREVDRFGGWKSMGAAERMFTADSDVVVDVLRFRRSRHLLLELLPTAVLTVDAMLDGLGMPVQRRAGWCAARSGARPESGADYRQWKALLRPLLSGARSTELDGSALPLGVVLGRLRDAGMQMAGTIRLLDDVGDLTRDREDIYASLIHLHLNRLLRADHLMERRVFGLLHRLYHGLAESQTCGQQRNGR